MFLLFWFSGQKQTERHSAVRNTPWKHMQNEDVISMPDKWEFPWVNVVFFRAHDDEAFGRRT